MTTGLQLGRPGVYEVTQPRTDGLQPVRLDVTGFVGVALRGPVNQPIPVTSWSDYERQFGGFERPNGGPDRLLSYAVQAFFAQGGDRAYVVRLAPPPSFSPTAEDATATYLLDGISGSWQLSAADEGTWGGALKIVLSFEVAQTFRATATDTTHLLTAVGAAPDDQTLLRIRQHDLPPTGVFRWMTRVVDPSARGRAVELDQPLPADDANGPDPWHNTAVDVDVVTGVLSVQETTYSVPRGERLTGLGLRPGHPRFIATVPKLSALVTPTGEWNTPIVPDRFLSPLTAKLITPGLDRSYGIGDESFFDDGDAGADPLDEEEHPRGVDAMGRKREIGLLCVPDLIWRAEKPVPPPPPPPPVRRPSPCDVCAPIPADEEDLAGPLPVPAALDPRNPDDLAVIIQRQNRLVQVAELRHRFVVLLDAPAELPVDKVTDWRARFDSSYAAAYHPWLGVPRVVTSPTDRDTIVAVPPSAFAAGIIAAREQRVGLSFGPANELALGAVMSIDTVTDSIHDQLHRCGVNVFRAERDGLRLSAARTMSSDQDYVQLSIRRFMTMLALTLERQTAWLVFEPNTSELRARLTHTVTQFLRDQHRRGAFAGDTDATSFFVTCDGGLNPPESQAQGRLIAEIGVALAAPLEFLVLRITQDVDGGIAIGTEGG
jgi:hypothetical protein